MKTAKPETCGFEPERLESVVTGMNRFIHTGTIAGYAASIARGGVAVMTCASGLMDREARREMTTDAIFRIASMTKPVTAVAAMMLYEEGYFTLNTPVSAFLPGFDRMTVVKGQGPNGLELEKTERPITMRHLFTHTAGLSYGFLDDDPVDVQYRDVLGLQNTAPDPVTKETLTNEVLVQRLSAMPLAFQPGSRWRYSLSIDVIGRIVEVISGVPLDLFLRHRLFDPLNMTDTDFFVPENKTGRFTALYGRPAGESALVLLEAPSSSSYLKKPMRLSGGDGLVSTLSDYTAFAQMLAGKGALGTVRVLSPGTVDLFTRNLAPPEVLPYGFVEEGEDLFHKGYGFSLGTRVLMDVAASGKAGSVGEFGWDGAFNTYFWVDPTLEISGVFLTQHSPNNQFPLADTFKTMTYAALLR